MQGGFVKDQQPRVNTISRKIKSAVALLSVLSVMAVLFDNCAASHSSSEQSATAASTSTGSFSSCSLSGPQNLFQLTYQPFLQTNCATCHTETGAAAGFPFASEALETAYESFNAVGYTTVDTYAVNPGHQPPYTGTQNQSAINALSQQWTQGVEELSTCTQSTVPVFVTDTYAATRTNSRSIAINPNPTSAAGVKVEWDLNNDMLPSPAGVTWPTMPGAKFQITVIAVNNGAETHYLFTQPTILYPTGTTGAVDLNVQSIMIKLNGVTVQNETTFTFVNSNAYANTTTLLASGGMVSLGSIRASDVMSFSIGQMSVVSLPPLPPPPAVSFSASSANVDVNSGTYNLTVTLNEAVNNIVTVNYSAHGGTGVPNCCTTINNTLTNTVATGQINWNRDYGLPANSGNFVVFPPNVTSLTIPITIYANQRYTPNFPTVIIGLDSMQVGSAAVQSLTSPPLATITITNSNTQPPVGAVTFSNLMGPGGAFALNCVGCHFPGNVSTGAVPYDMTTYTSLIADQRVVPGDATDSLVWIRINDPPVQNGSGVFISNGISAMPLSGVFNPQDPTGKTDIFTWIMGGALNN
jgi:hypothetical protein